MVYFIRIWKNVRLVYLQMYFSHIRKCISPTFENLFLPHREMYFSDIGKCFSPTLGNVFLLHYRLSLMLQPSSQQLWSTQPCQIGLAAKYSRAIQYPEKISRDDIMISRDHNIQRWNSKLIFQRGIQRPEIILPLMSSASLPKYGPSFVPWSQVYSDEFLSGPDMIISCWRSWICKSVPLWPAAAASFIFAASARSSLWYYVVLTNPQCGVDSTQHPFFSSTQLQQCHKLWLTTLTHDHL